ncbi:hypothetical protein LINPERHAP1_LOCUS31874 [Linum perenne]
MNRGEDFIGMLIADLLLPLDFWSDKEKRSMVGGFWCSETDMVVLGQSRGRYQTAEDRKLVISLPMMTATGRSDKYGLQDANK